MVALLHSACVVWFLSAELCAILVASHFHVSPLFEELLLFEYLGNKHSDVGEKINDRQRVDG